MRRRYSIALILAVVVGVSSAVAVAARQSTTDHPDGAPVQFAPGRAAVAGFADSPRAGAAAIASQIPGINHSQIASISSHGPGAVLSFDISVPDFGGAASLYAMWRSDLYAGAMADKLPASNLGALTEVQATMVTPDGSRMPLGGGMGNVTRNQRFDSVPADIQSTVARSAASFGLKDITVESFRVLQDAVVIRGTTDSPKEAASVVANQPLLLSTLLGVPPTNYEGVFFEVVDQAGAPVLALSTAARAGSGGFWVDPALGLKLPRGIPTQS